MTVLTSDPPEISGIRTCSAYVPVATSKTTEPPKPFNTMASTAPWIVVKFRSPMPSSLIVYNPDIGTSAAASYSTAPILGVSLRRSPLISVVTAVRGVPALANAAEPAVRSVSLTNCGSKLSEFASCPDIVCQASKSPASVLPHFPVTLPEVNRSL